MRLNVVMLEQLFLVVAPGRLQGRPTREAAPLKGTGRRDRGLTLLELVIGMAIAAILAMLAAPAFGEWVRGAQVRTAAESWQNTLRTAQAEAVARARAVVIYRTDAEPGLGATVSATGRNWVVRWVPLQGEALNAAAPDLEPLILGVSIQDVAARVQWDGPGAVCFNAAGRRTALANTGVAGLACVMPPAPATGALPVSGWTFSHPEGGARPLRVELAFGGSVRMCDPARDVQQGHADGCN